MVDRSLSLGGGRTPVRVFEGDTVGHLKQSIHRQCAIEPTTHTLLLHKYNLEPLEHDDELLDTIGITDRSSVFVSLQGTLTNQIPSSPLLLHRLIGLDWIELDWIGLNWIGLDWIGLDWIR